MLVIDLREKKDDKFSSRPEMNTMGSDIYHLILQALIDDLHLSGFHAVWSATTTKKKKKRLMTWFTIFPTGAETFLSQKEVLVGKGVATSVSVKGLTGFSFMASEAKIAQTEKGAQ